MYSGLFPSKPRPGKQPVTTTLPPAPQQHTSLGGTGRGSPGCSQIVPAHD